MVLQTTMVNYEEEGTFFAFVDTNSITFTGYGTLWSTPLDAGVF